MPLGWVGPVDKGDTRKLGPFVPWNGTLTTGGQRIHT